MSTHTATMPRPGGRPREEFGTISAKPTCIVAETIGCLGQAQVALQFFGGDVADEGNVCARGVGRGVLRESS